MLIDENSLNLWGLKSGTLLKIQKSKDVNKQVLFKAQHDWEDHINDNQFDIFVNDANFLTDGSIVVFLKMIYVPSWHWAATSGHGSITTTRLLNINDGITAFVLWKEEVWSTMIFKSISDFKKVYEIYS